MFLKWLLERVPLMSLKQVTDTLILQISCVTHISYFHERRCIYATFEMEAAGPSRA